VIDERVVRALWSDGQLRCARLLGARARLLVDRAPSSAATIHHAGTAQACRPRRCVLLTLIRACDLTTVLEVGLSPTSTNPWPSDT
jgi:hypothetical protein